jgi:hypothetical protein
MGSDDEIMIHRFMEEEAATDTDEEEHIGILMGLLQLQSADDAAPILGGSSAGRKKSKTRQRLEEMSCSTTTISPIIQHTMQRIFFQ